MTPQEQQMLDGLIERVRNTNLPSKDNDADRHIQDTLGRDPNALYILCQTVLVQGYALEQAQKQLAAQQQQASQPQQERHQPSFLEKIFGKSDDDKDDPNAQPQYGQPGYGRPGYNSPGTQPQYNDPNAGTRPGYGQPTYAPPQAYPPPQGYPPQQGYPPPQQGGFGSGFGGGGFLQGALQTAAGVAMGEMAFQSIEGLFRGFGREAGYGSDRAMGFGDVNAGSDSHDFGQGDGFFSREQAENGVNDQLSPDIEDRRGDSSSFASGNDDNSGSGFLGDDNGNGNDYDTGSSFDDSGSFDDGGSFDDSNS